MSSSGHGEPSGDEIDPDEPRTPLWLPLLGLCLFLGALVYVLVGQKSPPANDAAPSPSASAEAAPAASAAAP